VVAARQITDEAEEWGERAAAALSTHTTVDELRSLMADAASLRAVPPDADDVRARIEDMSSFASDATASLTRRMHVDELDGLLDQAKRAAVPEPQIAPLRARRALVSWWGARACSAFLKEGCRVSLLCALRADPPGPELMHEDGTWTSALACTYCTGTDVATTSQFMIGCDACERWYHGPCVGVGKAAADAMDDYLCPLCATEKGVEYAFGPPLPVPKLTRRPRLKYVRALLTELDEIGVDTPEAAMVREAEQAAEQWQARASALLDDESDDEGDEAEGEGKAEEEEEEEEGGGARKRQKTGGGAGKGKTKGGRAAAVTPPPASRTLYDPGVVEAMLLEGEAMEVEPDGLAAVRKLASQFASWYRVARGVLGGEYSVDAPLLDAEVDAERALDGLPPLPPSRKARDEEKEREREREREKKRDTAPHRAKH